MPFVFCGFLTMVLSHFFLESIDIMFIFVKCSATTVTSINTYESRDQQYQPSKQSVSHSKTCPSCDAEIDASETFCPECVSRV